MLAPAPVVPGSGSCRCPQRTTVIDPRRRNSAVRLAVTGGVRLPQDDDQWRACRFQSHAGLGTGSILAGPCVEADTARCRCRALEEPADEAAPDGDADHHGAGGTPAPPAERGRRTVRRGVADRDARGFLPAALVPHPQGDRCRLLHQQVQDEGRDQAGHDGHNDRHDRGNAAFLQSRRIVNHPILSCTR